MCLLQLYSTLSRSAYSSRILFERLRCIVVPGRWLLATPTQLVNTRLCSSCLDSNLGGSDVLAFPIVAGHWLTSNKWMRQQAACIPCITQHSALCWQHTATAFGVATGGGARVCGSTGTEQHLLCLAVLCHAMLCCAQDPWCAAWPRGP